MTRSLGGLTAAGLPLWFAKDWNYLLVRLSQIESDGQHYEIVLKDATMDGEPVIGDPAKRD